MLHDDYRLNSDTPGGVQQNLVDGFLRTTKVGNLEQFVTGFVLLARSLGVDARVATGYTIAATGSTSTISTSNADAWPEVRTAAGWVTVDLVPQESPRPRISPQRVDPRPRLRRNRRIRRRSPKPTTTSQSWLPAYRRRRVAGRRSVSGPP